MVPIQIFMTGLLAVSILTTLTTQALKKAVPGMRRKGSRKYYGEHRISCNCSCSGSSLRDYERDRCERSVHRVRSSISFPRLALFHERIR